jgi:nucleoside-diphosphate-sugar epimerase
MNILVTGKNGFIGKHIVESLSEKYNVISTCSSELDLTSDIDVKEFFKDKKIDIVINTAVIGGKTGNNDTSDILYDNICMIFNIIKYKSKNTILFNFTSGAELENNKLDFNESYPLDYYGMSKNIISRICNNMNDVYTFRLFGVFGEYENNYRFIKKNITKYINKENLCIKKDRFLDFIYIDNITKVVDYYILNLDNNLKHFIDITTPNKNKLSHILSIINNLSDYKVDIIIDDETNDDISYIGDGDDLLRILPNYLTIDKGIEKVFKYLKIKNEK